MTGRGRTRLGDGLFHGPAAGSGGFVVVLIALVAVFLVTRAAPVIGKDQAKFLFSCGFSLIARQSHKQAFSADHAA